MDAQGSNQTSGSERTEGTSPPSKGPLPLRRFLGLLVVLALAAGGYAAARKAYTLLVTNNPSKAMDSEGIASEDLESRKSAILSELNKEISGEKKQGIYERFKLLAALRSFFRSLPGRDRQGSGRTGAGEGREAMKLEPPSGQEGCRPEKGGRSVDLTALASRRVSEHLKPVIVANGNAPGAEAGLNEYAAPVPEETDFSPSVRPAPTRTHSLYEVPVDVKPLEGVNTKGIAWKIHRRVMLEGIFDASSIGRTEPELQDFGLRSMHAQTLLEYAPKPEFLFGRERIESGFPRSFGIGVNLQLNPSLNLIFDYVHEFSNDYRMEYTGNWESSLVSDYSRIRTDDKNATHSFFLGMRYLYRHSGHLMPIHTGFFYTTTMAQEPLASDVSLGFTLGTGMYLKGVRLGVAYRMRIWETPDELLLLEKTTEIPKKITNQLLFQAHF